MDLNEIYTLCNYIANKHKSGNAFTINQFNALINIITPDFFKKKAEESGYFKRSKIAAEIKELYSSKFLREFVINETVSTTGSFTYAYAYWIGAHDSDNDVLVELVSEDEYHDRMSDSVMAPASDCICAVERSTEVVVYPSSINNINVSYLRYPETPFLDYYINATGYIQFLVAGATHTWANGEVDSSGTTHTSADPDWGSLTVELEFIEDMHMDFLNELLSRVGIRLSNPMLIQASEGWKAEQKSM